MKALILNKQVMDIAEVEFEVSPSFTWVECDNTVQVGWVYNGSTFTDLEPPVTDDDLAFSIREERDYLLAKSDWTQATDSPLTDAKKAQWVTYRQALRDITSQNTFPTNVTYPVEPE